MLDALLLRTQPPILPTGLRPGSLRDKALGAYLGLAIGDALGATTEFMTPREIAAQYGVHRHMSGGGWLKLAPGQVTDDTTMCLALGKAILDADGWCMKAVAEAYVAWLRSKPVDCGNTCRRGIRRYMTDGSFAGPAGDGDAGNGAVMRNLPVVLATLHDEPAFEARSLAQARFTHNNPLSDAATLICGRLLRRLLLGGQLTDCRRLADAFVVDHPQFRFQPYPGRASGYVVDTLQTVFHFTFSEAGFEAALIGAVNRGDDADTTAALVGMLHGAQCGASALPRAWLERLDRTIAAAIVTQTDALLNLAARPRPCTPPRRPPMTHVVFYEKPGCGGNAKQKAWLESAGHTLEVRSLLAWPWTADSLLAFLAPLPVAEWFNRAAPRVKSGEVVPEQLDRDTALALLLAEPLLIRRPLMEAGGQRLVGFEPKAVAAWLDSPGLAQLDGRRTEGCAATDHLTPCPSLRPSTTTP